MAYSSSDFQGDVINHMLALELLPSELVESDEVELIATHAKSRISHLCIRRDRNEAALKFHDELLQSVETLSGIADEHGSVALANMNYLQTAILRGGNIELSSKDEAQLEMLRGLPSGDQWLKHVTIVE
jgi:hypothetical protein